MEKILLRSKFKQMKDKKVFGSSQHRFTKGKSCLSNLIALYNEVISLVEEARRENVVYLYFGEAFNTVSHNTIIDKLTKYGLEICGY